MVPGAEVEAGPEAGAVVLEPVGEQAPGEASAAQASEAQMVPSAESTKPPEPKHKSKKSKEKEPKTETPVDEKQQRKIDVHRANSIAWRKKWVKKGVPRASTTNEEETGAGSAGREDMPIVSLSKARKDFVREWIQKSDTPPSHARRKAAMDAWMASSVRADVMAGRNGTQK